MKQHNFVWQARYTATVADEKREFTQLIAAQTLRKALVKAEKFMEAQGADSAELVALVKMSDVVI